MISQVALLGLLVIGVTGLALDVNVDYHPETIASGRISKQREVMAIGKTTPEEEKNADFWISMARSDLAKRLNEQVNLRLGKAKNIIMFLGDGMSLTTITAARILKGQRQNRTGEEEVLFFERFPTSGLSKTYCSNAQVADSACTATAYLTGVKSNIFMLGVTAAVNFNNCTASMNPANRVSSLADWAQAAGKSTGFVTTTQLTHASPAPSYGHVANRRWECDTDILRYSDNDPATCMDLAQQLVNELPGKNFDVMMGGGSGKFVPKELTDMHGNLGERSDGKNLLDEWKTLHPKGAIISNRNELLNMNFKNVTNIMGLFQSKLMDYHYKADAEKQPTLAEMTEVTIKKLSQNGKGYFAFIEGGLIDYGNHATTPGVSCDETLEFEKAIKVAREMTNIDDTLIVVTADHGHPLSMTGYPGRGTNILGINEHDLDVNGVPYATLNYAMGYQQYLDAQGNRIDLTGIIGQKDDLSFQSPSYIKAYSGQHSGEDVGVFASGPHAHLFNGYMQQHTIPHLMAYAACIGDGPTMCKKK